MPPGTTDAIEQVLQYPATTSKHNIHYPHNTQGVQRLFTDLSTSINAALQSTNLNHVYELKQVADFGEGSMQDISTNFQVVRKPNSIINKHF